MKYVLIFQMLLGTLLAHGKEHEHLHLFSSLHMEYFVFFVVGLFGAYLVYDKFFKGNR
ncbi:hypothetical protein [Sulfurimonas sp.]|jgi:hypothetical protein|uniref:hypothetical protein n=1 Tax=Sulfurimonas sp. TaxID=2022749 RepID=UPI00286D9BA2|nr:hypothetical protein [Sulfurimonas sp.]